MKRLNCQTIPFLMAAISISIVSRSALAQNEKRIRLPDGWSVTLDQSMDGVRQRISVYDLLTDNWASQKRFKHTIHYLFPMDTEDYEKIQEIFDFEEQVRDGVEEAATKSIADEIRQLVDQGFSTDDERVAPLIAEYNKAQRLVWDEYFDQAPLRNEALADLFDEDELQKLRDAALNTAILVKGGIAGLYRDVITRNGLGTKENRKKMTREQAQRIEKLETEYQKRLKELNLEFGKRLLDNLSPEEKDAMIDFIGTRGLEKKRQGN